MGLFGKSQEKNPKEMVQEWTHKLRKEGYQLDRQVRAIQREEEKIKRSLKEAAKKATIRVAGSVQKSTEVMQAMQSLVRVPEVAATMRELSKEMMKAGIIEEMLDETMESVEDSEEVEDEADEEIDKILWEVTAGQLGTAPAVVTETPGSVIASTSAEEESEDVNDKELEEMKLRLQSLRS
ncbi:hypothetical protein QLX08_000750 [Tetragonisca angustula]|uniref:Charged multivesicular body protein 3 n=1 Tax=Tetragonisca angustula TaxID=166442 RepID=A0AAW1AJ13_9HYME